MVAPNLVIGTLKIGYDLLQGLTEPFARGLFLHCLIAEVHPFDDGNGRISRLHFTAELLRADQAHVIIPTVYRDDYINGMRSLTRRRDPAPITRATLRAQETSAADLSAHCRPGDRSLGQSECLHAAGTERAVGEVRSRHRNRMAGRHARAEELLAGGGESAGSHSFEFVQPLVKK